MSETSSIGHAPSEPGTYKYGMLLGIVALWCYGLWNWRTSTPEVRSSAVTNVVVVTMLLVNHVISSFLSIEQRRRVRLAQLLFMIACALFVFRRLL